MKRSSGFGDAHIKNIEKELNYDNRARLLTMRLKAVQDEFESALGEWIGLGYFLAGDCPEALRPTFPHSWPGVAVPYIWESRSINVRPRNFWIRQRRERNDERKVIQRAW